MSDLVKKCNHKWIRRSDSWVIFYCDKCGVLGYFQKRGRNSFKIIPYICQTSKCKNFATKSNDVGERYCNKHYVEKYHKDWACRGSNRRHAPINPEIYYKKFTGKKR